MSHIYFQGIDRLPLELLDIIMEYVPISFRLTFNRHFYNLYHSQCIRNSVPKAKFETFIRTMIHQDNDFVVGHLLQENWNLWIRLTKYYHKACIYANYITFLEFYAEEVGSTKCEELIYQWNQNNIPLRKGNRKIVEYILWSD